MTSSLIHEQTQSPSSTTTTHSFDSKQNIVDDDDDDESNRFASHQQFEALEAGRRAHQMDKDNFPLRCASDPASDHRARRAHSLSRAAPGVAP